jgi:hypothetical protein
MGRAIGDILPLAIGVSTAASVAALLTVCGCSPSHMEAQPKTQKTQSADLCFVAASSRVSAKCRTTARAVGYPVPCPTRLPVGFGPNVTDPGGVGGSDRSWQCVHAPRRLDLD